MKRSLILFFVTVQCINAHPIIFSNNTGDGINSKRDDAQRDSAELALHRQRRDAIGKNLEATVTHLQQTARIANAIALQQGLAAGTININTLIPELLIFGDVTLDEIVQLDDNLPNTLASLKDLPTKVSGSKNVKNFEKYFLAVHAILDAFDGFDTLSEWRGKSDFTDDLDKLIKQDVDMGIIRNMSFHLTEWQSKYNNLKRLSTTTDFTQDNVQKLKDLKEHSQKLIELSAQEFSNPVFFKNNNTASTSFSEVIRLIEAFEVYDSKNPDIKSRDKNSDASMETSLNEISKRFSNISVNGPNEVLQRLFAWKLSPSSLRLTKFTPGLPKGYSDIGQVFIDLNSPFIKQLVDTGKLEIAVRPLKELGSTVGKLNQKLDANVLKESDEISSLLDKLKDLNRGTSDIPAIMSASAVLGSCAPDAGVSPDDPGKQNMTEKVMKLDDRIATIQQFIGEARQMLISDKDLLEETIKACTAIDKTDQQEINDEFKKFLANQKVLEAFKLTGRLQTNLLRTELDEVSTAAKKVEEMLKDVDGYYSKVSVYQPFFDCLRKEKNRNIVFSAVSISKNLRENATDFTESVDKVIGVAKKVIDTKGDLKAMDSTLKKMKGLKSPEVDALKIFSDAQKHSNVIGGATQGVVSMTKAIKEKENLVAGFGLVEAGMKKIGMRSKRAISDKDLNSFLAMQGQVDQMFNSLGQFNNGAKDLKVKKFQDLSAIFLDAQKIPGVKLDFPAIGQSVGELADKINDASSPELKKLQSTFNSLDLDFSKHQKDFADSKSSLSQLDVFFAKMKTKFAPVPAPNGRNPLPPSNNGSQSGSQGTSGSASQQSEGGSSDATSKPEDQTPVGVIVVVLLVVVFIIVAVFASIGYVLHPCCFTVKAGPKMFRKKARTRKLSLSAGLKYLSLVVNRMRQFKNAHTLKVPVKPVDLFREYFDSLFNGLRCDTIVDTPKIVVDNVRECRYEMALVVETRVVIRKGKYEFASDFIHANLVTFDSGLRFILSQAPQDGVRLKKATKDKEKAENILKTWIMVRQEKMKDIVMLCQRWEPDKKGKLREKCGKYFPEELGEVLTLEMLTIKCIEKTSMFDDEVILRTITVKFDDSEEFTVRHFQYMAWPDFGVPTNLKAIIGLLKLVRRNQTPVYVHCVAGLGRSGSFAMIEMGYEELCETGDVNFSKLVIKLRDQRAGAVQSKTQLALCVQGIVEWGIEGALLDPEHPKLNSKQLDEWTFIKGGFESFAKEKEENDEPKKAAKGPENDKDVKDVKVAVVAKASDAPKEEKKPTEVKKSKGREKKEKSKGKDGAKKDEKKGK